MPWIHLHVGYQGKVSACCVANIPFGNINSNSIDEIWNGKNIKDLREKFLKGEMDNRCGACINIEKAGGKSIRMETHEKFDDIDVTQIEAPIYYDIRFSNLCNLKCRTCWHGASSSWFDDAKELKSNLGEKAIIMNVHDYERFIDLWGESILKAKEIYFAGGEPLMMEEHYRLLKYLIENEAVNIHLRYNTNISQLTYKDENLNELWSKFTSVEIMASLDAHEEKGEYIRQNLKWNKVEENLQLLKSYQNIYLKLAPTISTMNTDVLVDFIPYMIDKGFIDVNDIYINLLERPHFYNVKSYTSEEKKEVEKSILTLIDYLKEKEANELTIASFHDIISFMNEKDLSKLRPKAHSYNQKLDQLFTRK